MDKKNIDIFLDKLSQSVIQKASEFIVREIDLEYKQAIDAFYNDYNPVFYDRTYSTYEGISTFSHHGINYKKNILNNGKYAKTINIRISGKNIIGNPYARQSISNVIKNGIQNKGQELNSLIFFQTFVKGAHGHTIPNHYKPKKMSPTPKQLFDESFKQIKKKDNLNSILKTITKETIRQMT